MSKSGWKDSSETREKKSRGQRRRRERDRQRRELGLPALEAFAAGGPLHPELVNDLREAQAEAHSAALALGAEEDALSPQQVALLRSFSRLGIIERGLLRLWIKSEDPDLAPKLTTVIRERRGLLQTLGLHRFERQLDVTRGITVEWSSEEDGSAAKPRPGGDAGAASPSAPASPPNLSGDDS